MRPLRLYEVQVRSQNDRPLGPPNCQAHQRAQSYRLALCITQKRTNFCASAVPRGAWHAQARASSFAQPITFGPLSGSILTDLYMDTHSLVQGSHSSSTLGQQQQEPGVLNSVLQHAIQSQLGINISQESAAIRRLGSQVLQGAGALSAQAADAEAGTGAAPAPAGAAETAAAEAERHRLSSTQALDLQASAWHAVETCLVHAWHRPL
jgi:hypothetical protein